MMKNVVAVFFLQFSKSFFYARGLVKLYVQIWRRSHKREQSSPTLCPHLSMEAPCKWGMNICKYTWEPFGLPIRKQIMKTSGKERRPFLEYCDVEVLLRPGRGASLRTQRSWEVWSAVQRVSSDLTFRIFISGCAGPAHY